MASQSTKPGTRAKSIGHYILMKTIGEGTFGKVKLGTHILTGERVAVKVLEKERIVDIADVERVAREIHILKLIRQCRHIIQLYEIIETPRQLYLIMEYAEGGELFDYIVQHGRAEEKEACRFLHQILAGVERVHEMNIVHRDLKPENLLLDDRKDIKIVDFGLSNTYQDGQLLQTACGSPCYAAPEMIAGHKYVPDMVDIWSCGVILFALVCGFLPFEDQNHSELYKKILAAEYEMPDFVSKEVADLISGMLTTDPTQRLTLEQIRQHPWYRQMPEASLIDREDVNSLDEEILEQLDSYGFPRDYAVRCLSMNKHNHVTTTYYLIKDKRMREKALGGDQVTNLAIADLEAAGHDEDSFSGLGIAPLSAVAAVATPSRGREGGPRGGEYAGDGVPEGSGPLADGPGWLSGRTEPEPGAVPRLDLGELSGEGHSGYERPRGERSGAQTARGPRPSDAVRLASPRAWAGERPLADRPSSRAGYAGTPRSAAPTGASRYSRSHPPGGDGGYPTSRRRPSEPSSRCGYSGYGGGGYGGPGGYGGNGHREASAERASSARGGPPTSARPRLQGNATGGRPLSARYAAAPYSARGYGAALQEEPREESAFQVSCGSTRAPRQIVQEVLRALTAHGLSHRQVSSFVVRSQAPSGVRFQAEVLQLDRGGGYALRFSRVSGDVWYYKDICARLLSEMHL